MVNRKLKKKTLKKKSKNKTKKKYMNRRDIENLFMMSSFQRGGVDLHGGGPKERLQGLTRQIAHGTKFQLNKPPSEPETHTSSTSDEDLLEPFRVQPQQVEETYCNTLLQELTEMLENIINEFNSP